MAEKKYTRIVVEENNEHGFDSYRVPGIVTASKEEKVEETAELCF